MQSMWKGSVSFGLVNVPVKLYAATEDHDVRFHQVHAADGGRVKMVRTCSVDGQPVAYADLAKAYETSSGELVVMEERDFDALPVPGKREIDVLEFVPSDQVDPVLFDRSYYLEPEARALKPYVLLREALRTTERTALVRVVLRQKAQLAALRVRDDVILMQTMLWPDEVRRATFDVLHTDAEVRPQELAMASSLIDSLSSDFDPDEYHDDYREALLEVIDRKVAGGAGVPADTATVPEDEGDAIVVDLMAALRESVKRTSAGEDARAQNRPAGPATRAAPKKAAAKKAAAKKAVGTKSAASKPTPRKAAGPTKAAAKKAASKPARRRSA
ncbi:non-homologous end joining protein Ku [Longivirga aurantiaca]|uniref:Non-homologous end joining protein Ku n=1 Tax=Longivirga aurantiaca TaxID=1837743 RepID=A0ABW1T4F0_9ACTN